MEKNGVPDEKHSSELMVVVAVMSGCVSGLVLWGCFPFVAGSDLDDAIGATYALPAAIFLSVVCVPVCAYLGLSQILIYHRWGRGLLSALFGLLPLTLWAFAGFVLGVFRNIPLH